MLILRLLHRLLSLAAVLLLLVVFGVAGALWISLPPDRQSVDIAGLSAPVDISFDQDGVPRIHAQTMQDAVSALGFVHARDRMFEMDLMRRVVSGRLAEVAGSSVVPVDVFMRTIGMRRAAVDDLANLPGDTRAMLQAYANGVNAWTAQRGRFASAENVALGRPEAWEPVDCLLWAKMMGLYLSGNMRTELSRLALAGKLPPGRIDELWPRDSGAGHPAASLDARFADAAGAVVAIDFRLLLVGDRRVRVDARSAFDEVARVRQVDGGRGAVDFRFFDGNDVVRAEEPAGFHADEFEVTRLGVGPERVNGADLGAALVEDRTVEEVLGVFCGGSAECCHMVLS